MDNVLLMELETCEENAKAMVPKTSFLFLLHCCTCEGVVGFYRGGPFNDVHLHFDSIGLWVL
jgi:hypothetical protein